jgi:hypothetical protein
MEIKTLSLLLLQKNEKVLKCVFYIILCFLVAIFLFLFKEYILDKVVFCLKVKTHIICLWKLLNVITLEHCVTDNINQMTKICKTFTQSTWLLNFWHLSVWFDLKKNQLMILFVIRYYKWFHCRLFVFNPHFQLR